MKHALIPFLSVLVVVQACSLKEPADLGAVCNNGNISYILEKSKDTCHSGQGCYEDAFEAGRCPSGFLCGMDEEGNGFCYNTCGNDEIMCNGRECLKTNNGVVISDNAYCGARGMCSDEGIPSSKNYRGVACTGSTACDNGECVCVFEKNDPNHCAAKGLCNSKTIGSSNFIGYDCGENSICSEGACGCDEEYTQCEDVQGDALHPFICVANDDFMTDERHCGGCNQKCDGECIKGVCKRNCEGNVCGENDQCRNANNRCGSNCSDCSANAGNREGLNVCDMQSGVCRNCEPGNEYDSVSQKCISPEATKCGDPGKDCRDHIQNWASDSLICDNGTCKVTKCEDGYHPSVKQDSCTADSAHECGVERIDCLEMTNDGSKSSYVQDKNAADIICEAGKCVSVSCRNSSEYIAYAIIKNENTGKSVETFAFESPAECKALNMLPSSCCDSGLFLNTFCIKEINDQCTACNTALADEGYSINLNGYYMNRNYYIVDPDTKRCRLATENTYCSDNGDNCSSMGMNCISYKVDFCSHCGTKDLAIRNKCQRKYKCGCAPGYHVAPGNGGCVVDSNRGCGAEVKDCYELCKTQEGNWKDCDSNDLENSTICKNGVCLVNKCLKGKSVCPGSNSCVEGGALSMSCIGSYSELNPCDYGGLIKE